MGWPRMALLRHGESLGNVANVEAYASKALELDVPANDPSIELSDRGRRQATAVGRRLHDILGWRPTVVVASPYARARQTAQLVVDAGGLGGVTRVVDERLRDREQGVLDRLTWYGVKERYPSEWERRQYLGKFWYRPPGGESWADVSARLRAALRDLRLDHGEENLLVVTHDVPILIARYILEGMSVDEVVALSGQIANCALTTYRCDGERPQLVSFNQSLETGREA